MGNRTRDQLSQRTSVSHAIRLSAQTKPPTYVVALDEKWCGVVVRSGLTATDHIAFPMRCLSELPEFQRFVDERYAVERSFERYNVLRLRTMPA